MTRSQPVREGPGFYLQTAWRSEVYDRLPQVQDRLGAAERELEATRAELRGLHGLVEWLEEPAKSYGPREAAKNTNYIVRGGIRNAGAA